MHQHQCLEVGIGPLVGPRLELQLPTSELDWKDRLSCPIQLQLEQTVTAFDFIELSKRRAGADMCRQFGSCKGELPATPRHKLLQRDCGFLPQGCIRHCLPHCRLSTRHPCTPALASLQRKRRICRVVLSGHDHAGVLLR